MKKILLLGGSAQQIVAIETAKKLGYYTIVCDYLKDNPGQYHADKFYLVSTTDKDAILEVAQEEKIHGVLAYASDPAAPTAAYVAEKLGLATNSYQSVKTLCNKDLFRMFLAENGFNTPLAKGYCTMEDAIEDIEKYQFPIIIKPVDSSGSKGATVVRLKEDLNKAIDFAFQFSRNHRIIIEEFIEKKHPYLVGGDIFVQDGKVILWGLLNCHRDNEVNDLVPVGKSYPLALELDDIQKIKNTLQDIVDKLHILNGAMNVELVLDVSNKVWPIDIGPRNGGNMIPDLLGEIFNVDIVELTIKNAMGEIVDIKDAEDIPFWATHNLHSNKKGIYEDIEFTEEIKPFIQKVCIYKKPGDMIEFFDNASKALGIIFLKFEDMIQMEYYLSNINQHISIKLKEEVLKS